MDLEIVDTFDAKDLDPKDEARSPLYAERAPELQPQLQVWTPAAKGLMLGISLFVLVTTAIVIAIMILQWQAFSSMGLHIKDADMFVNWLMQPQTMVLELVLLGVAYHSVTTRNMVLVVAALSLNIHLVIAGFLELAQRQFDLNIFQDRDGNRVWQFVMVNRLLWTLPFVDLFFHIGCDWAAWHLYRELGWLAYKTLGTADRKLGKLYRRVLILRAVSWLSTTFSLLTLYTTLILALIGYQSSITRYSPLIPPQTPKLIAVCILAPLSAACWVVSLWPLTMAIRRESRGLGWVSLGLQGVGLAGGVGKMGLGFEAFDLVGRVTEGMESSWTNSPLLTPGNGVAEANQWKTYFLFIVSTVLMLVTILYTVLVMRGFGIGLKDKGTRVKEQAGSLQVDLSA